MYCNDSVNMPSNNVTHESPEIEPIIPSVMERESDRRENGKMPTPAVRRSERQNKGTNERLRADYEVYDVSYCIACKCKLGASATTYPPSCDFFGGASHTSMLTPIVQSSTRHSPLSATVHNK